MSDKAIGAYYNPLEPDTNKLSVSSIDSYQGLSHKASAGYWTRDDHKNIEGGQSVRGDFTRTDYEYFRPYEAIPTKPEDIIKSCDYAYRSIGLIRNVIDLMGDFGVQGIEIVHSNRQIQKFYQKWFKSINGPERSERFLNLLYRLGNVVVKRNTAKLSTKHEDYLRSLSADTVLEPDTEMSPILKLPNRVVPCRYDFYSPLVIQAAGGVASQFTGKQIYSLKINSQIRMAVSNPQNAAERELVSLLPPEVVSAIKSGSQSYPIDQNKIRVFFYKKDDWQTWADPMIYSLWSQIRTLEKMQLADLAALDGVISSIRLWKLGYISPTDPSKSIFPTEVAIAKLADILLSNPGGGAFDVIWGPDIELKESSTTAHQFLGEAKYVPILNAIYAGLGVPPTLTGAATSSGFTNNYISLKTMVQRLEYGRMVLRSFWEYELELVRRAMGFRLPAQLRFDRMILSDDAAEKALLVQLVDRNLISLETVLERFGEFPELEVLRMRREDKERDSGLLVQKASPYLDPQFDLKKTALGRGFLSPIQAGVLDLEKEDYKKPPFLMQLDSAEKTSAMKGASLTGNNVPSSKTAPSGRPKTSKDSVKRAPKTVKPRTSAEFIELMQYAKDAQKDIDELVTPALLKSFGKRAVRNLNEDELIHLEQTKFVILSKVPMYTKVTAELIWNILESPLLIDEAFAELYNELLAKYEKPKIEDIRLIQATVYSTLTEDKNE